MYIRIEGVSGVWVFNVKILSPKGTKPTIEKFPITFIPHGKHVTFLSDLRLVRRHAIVKTRKTSKILIFYSSRTFHGLRAVSYDIKTQ